MSEYALRLILFFQLKKLSLINFFDLKEKVVLYAGKEELFFLVCVIKHSSIYIIVEYHFFHCGGTSLHHIGVFCGNHWVVHFHQKTPVQSFFSKLSCNRFTDFLRIDSSILIFFICGLKDSFEYNFRFPSCFGYSFREDLHFLGS